MNSISILLADDHTIVRKGLRSLIDSSQQFEVVCEADNGHDAIEMVKQKNPDIVLMDISMPRLNGLEATRKIKKDSPDTKIIILTRHINEEYVFEMISIGASGYVLKKAAPQELIFALEAVSKDQNYFSPSISKIISDKINEKGAIPSSTPNSSITAREREVLQLIAEGYTNQKIAETLYISAKTVANHRSNIKDKLDLNSTAELTKYAIKHGITDINI
jgi:DNA-binding NarL/FixJ family response regulator